MEQSRLTATQLAILIIGDVLVILSFVGIGRRSHGLAITDIGDTLFTALPFIIGWFVVTPWFGIYKARVCLAWKKLVPRLLLAWAIAGPLALLLRALFLGRSIFTGIMPTFALIALAYIGLVALLWRLAYLWWVNRKQITGAAR